MIKYLENNNIDKEKWDSCVRGSFNGIIYAHSWYLDMVAPGWTALVQNDYEAVMPLPVREKFGISYAYVPHFCQQLGVFAKEGHLLKMDEFIDAIPKKIRFLEQKLNEGNTIEGELQFGMNVNQVLDISQDYSVVKKNYNRNCRRNIKKAEAVGFEIEEGMKPQEFSDFVFDNLKDELNSDTTETRQLLSEIITGALNRKYGEVVSLKGDDGKVHAAGFYMFNGNRLIFSVCASSKYGKENQAMYQLVDSQIKKHAGKFKYYDFSGSNDNGIAYFNSTFGAKPIEYPTIKISRLPWPFNKLKK